MNSTKSILIVGVGGQGIILTSKMLTVGLMSLGFDVKMSEIHGMSQRGGSVSAQIRYGERVHSPVIGPGEADILLSFEEMETYRWLEYAVKGAAIIMNSYQLPSAPILSGQQSYPEGITAEIQGMTDVLVVKAMEEALKLGSPRAMNMIMLGTLVRAADLCAVDWPGLMERLVKPAYRDINLAALNAGMSLVSGECVLPAKG